MFSYLCKMTLFFASPVLILLKCSKWSPGQQSECVFDGKVFTVLCDRLGIETTAEITVIDFLQPNVYAQPSEQLDWCRHP